MNWVDYLPADRRKVIPNAITLSRIVLLVPLGFFSFSSNPKAFGLLLIVFWMTDFFDGLFARMLKASSPLGAELDTIADSLGGVLITFYIYILFPHVITAVMPHLVFAGLLGGAYLCVSLYKIQRIGLHFWSAKLMGVATFIFQVHTSLLGFNRFIFFSWMAAYTLAMSEQILALLLGRPDYRTKTIFEVLR